jgi:hypothetical protein
MCINPNTPHSIEEDGHINGFQSLVNVMGILDMNIMYKRIIEGILWRLIIP